VLDHQALELDGGHPEDADRQDHNRARRDREGGERDARGDPAQQAAQSGPPAAR